MDTELQQLQYDVYKRTGWANESGENPYTTLTSDYLLEKLPRMPIMNDRQYRLEMHAYSSNYAWLYMDIFDRGEYITAPRADTPLKALLKLVIALDDAKELK